jgi:hypothetical protein
MTYWPVVLVSAAGGMVIDSPYSNQYEEWCFD